LHSAVEPSSLFKGSLQLYWVVGIGAVTHHFEIASPSTWTRNLDPTGCRLVSARHVETPRFRDGNHPRFCRSVASSSLSIDECGYRFARMECALLMQVRFSPVLSDRVSDYRLCAPYALQAFSHWPEPNNSERPYLCICISRLSTVLFGLSA
jgi:hypothetical protein